jgi:hypothetical protein
MKEMLLERVKLKEVEDPENMWNNWWDQVLEITRKE